MREDTENFKVIKLPPNGPKPGQSSRDWLYGKDKHMNEQLQKARQKWPTEIRRRKDK